MVFTNITNQVQNIMTFVYLVYFFGFVFLELFCNKNEGFSPSFQKLNLL